MLRLPRSDQGVVPGAAGASHSTLGPWSLPLGRHGDPAAIGARPWKLLISELTLTCWAGSQAINRPLFLYHYHSGFSTAPSPRRVCQCLQTLQVLPYLSPPCHSDTLHSRPHQSFETPPPKPRLPPTHDWATGCHTKHGSSQHSACPGEQDIRTHPPPVTCTQQSLLPPPIEISGFPAPILVDSIRSSSSCTGDPFQAHTHTHTHAYVPLRGD